jgi:hypothetical protein
MSRSSRHSHRPIRGRRKLGPWRVVLYLEQLEDRTLLSGLVSIDPLPSPPTLIQFNHAMAVEVGTLQTSTDRILYQVPQPAGRVSITARIDPTQSTLFDANLEPFDSSGNYLTQVDAFGGGSLVVQNTTGTTLQFELGQPSAQSTPPYMPPGPSTFPNTGPYYIGVSGKDNVLYDPTAAQPTPVSGTGSTGAFHLDVDETSIPSLNDSLQTAYPISLSTGQPTLLFDSFAPDQTGVQVYSVTVTPQELGSQGGLLAVHVQSVNGGGSPLGSGFPGSTFDPNLLVLGPNPDPSQPNTYVPLATNDDLTEADNSAGQQLFVQSPGTYFFEVSLSPTSAPLSPIAANAIQISTIVVPVSRQPDGEALATAVPLSFAPTIPTTVAGGIEAANDVRLYQVANLHQGEQVYFDVVAQTQGRQAISGNAFAATQLHPFLRAFDATGAPQMLFFQAVPDRSSETTARFSVPADGTYYFGISSTGNETYDPTQPFSGVGSPAVSPPLPISTGAFTLTFRVQSPVPANVPILTGAAVNGSLTVPGQVDTYAMQFSQSGLVEINVAPQAGSSLAPLVTLSTATGVILAQGSTTLGRPSVDLLQHLEPGSYYLTISGGPGGPTGAYTLATPLLTLASEPGQAAGFDQFGAIVGNFVDTQGGVKDTVPDVLTVNSLGSIEVLPGLPDGTFEPPVLSPLAPPGSSSVPVNGYVSGHCFSTNHLDLAIISRRRLRLYQGNGDGTFNFTRSVGTNALFTARIAAVAAAPLQSNNGLDDLVAITKQIDTAPTDPPNVMVLLSPTSKSPPAPLTFSVPGKPQAIVTGAFDQANNNAIDFAVISNDPNNLSAPAWVTVFLNQGDGTFVQGVQLRVPVSIPDYFLFAGTTQQGQPVLVASGDTGDVAALVGDNHGGFTLEPSRALPSMLARTPQFAAGDVTGSGNTDLVTGDLNVDGVVSVLPGNGDGSFAAPYPIAAATSIASLGVTPFAPGGPGDIVFTGVPLLPPATAVLLGGAGFLKGVPERITEFFPPGQLHSLVLRGRGDGTFQGINDPTTAIPPGSLAVADFNRDGTPDLVAGGIGGAVGSGDQLLTILLGRGNGTFAPPRLIDVGAHSFGGVIAADLNHDGLPSLAVFGPSPNNPGVPEVRVLLGKGDGTFAAPEVFDLPADLGTEVSGSLAAVDLTGDGYPELLFVNSANSTLDVLRNNHDGTFQPLGPPLPLPPGPFTLVRGSFFEDPGINDLAILSQSHGQGTLSIFQNDGKGNLHLAATVAVGPSPTAVTTGNFGGTATDLAVIDNQANTVTIIHNDGQGHFTALSPIPVGLSPQAIVAGQFSSAGTTDLAIANLGSGDVTILHGLGHEQFQVVPQAISSGTLDAFQTLVAGDFNGDGRQDLALGQAAFGQVQVLLNQGNDQFFKAGDVATQESRVQPILADLDGDHVPDEITVDQQGTILFRKGKYNAQGELTFEPPITLNDISHPAQDIALVHDGDNVRLAALGKVDGAIIFYSLNLLESPFATPGPVAGVGASHIASADLNQDGYGDLVVTNGATGAVSIFETAADGTFLPPITRALGSGASDIAMDTTSPAGPVILITNQLSGDVTVLRALPGGAISSGGLFRAGTGPYGMQVNAANQFAVTSSDAPAGIAVGQFAGAGAPDGAVIADSGANQLVYLQGDGQGHFSMPQGSSPAPTGSHPTAVVAGTFDLQKDSNLDVAVLNEGNGTVSIFRGNGDGTFAQQPVVIPVGSGATALSVMSVPGDRYPDLLVTDTQGDVLRLVGNGDGTFSEPPADPHIALAMAGPGRFVFANARGNDVAVTDASGAPVPLQQGNGIQAPSDIRIIDLGMDGQGHDHQALVVANSGGNNVFVYQGVDGKFDRSSEQAYSAGTDPVGVTIADINGDGVPDAVVANEGSNDVSLLVGHLDGGTYTLQAGPRLPVGRGPVSTALLPGDLSTGGLPSLAVANSLDNNVSILPGRGQGFFDSQDQHIVPTGLFPHEVIGGNFDGRPGADLVTINTGSNDITFISAAAEATSGTSIDVGVAPVAIAAFGDGVGGGMLVADSGSDSVTLLVDGENGPTAVRSQDVSTTPSDLLFSGTSGNAIEYVVVSPTKEEVISEKINLADTGPVLIADIGGAARLGTAEASVGPIGPTGPSIVALLGPSVLELLPEARTDASEGIRAAEGEDTSSLSPSNDLLLALSRSSSRTPNNTGGASNEATWTQIAATVWALVVQAQESKSIAVGVAPYLLDVAEAVLLPQAGNQLPKNETALPLSELFQLLPDEVPLQLEGPLLDRGAVAALPLGPPAQPLELQGGGWAHRASPGPVLVVRPGEEVAGIGLAPLSLGLLLPLLVPPPMVPRPAGRCPVSRLRSWLDEQEDRCRRN